MSQQLQIFMEKLLRELVEGVPAPRRVRLISDGTTFETWEPIHGIGIDAGSWASDAEALVQALIPELPKRRVQLTFIAEDSAGATLSTLLRTVTGTNPNAQDLGTQNGAKALADAIAGLAKTTDFVLEMARKFMQFQSEQCEKKDAALAEAHELFMALKKAELESNEQDSAASRIMLEQLQQGLPMFMQLIQHWATSPSKGLGGAAAAAAAATNGVKAS